MGPNNQDLIEHVLKDQYTSLYRYAFSLTHNEADAFDLVQETCLKAIKNSKSLKDPSKVNAWLFRILTNIAYTFLKKNKRFITTDELENTIYKEDTLVNIDLENALNKMNTKDKTVIILRYFEELSLEEIADITNENLSTVKSRLYRSLKKLRIEMEDHK